MRRIALATLAALAALITFLAFRIMPSSSAAPLKEPRKRWEPVAAGLELPVGMSFAPGDSKRIYALEQKGRVRIVIDGRVRRLPFLDLPDRTRKQQEEQGLLGLAFHPRFRSNHAFFLYYTNLNEDIVVSRWTAATPDRADPGSEEILLTEKKPYANHNGGALAFGPDGYLYIGVGDGGSTGDPQGRAQDISTRLGKILRIDVDHRGKDRPYAVPFENPFVRTLSAAPEIWARGLCNPRRFSFDGPFLFIADAGQDRWEEINIEDVRDGGGRNYGWRYFDGNEAFKLPNGPPDDLPFFPEGLAFPITFYGHHDGNCAVVGGYVHRGKSMPDIDGSYIYGDFCSARVWALKYRKNNPAAPVELTPDIVPAPGLLRIGAFGQDPRGNVYVVSYDGGTIYRLENAP